MSKLCHICKKPLDEVGGPFCSKPHVLRSYAQKLADHDETNAAIATLGSKTLPEVQEFYKKVSERIEYDGVFTQAIRSIFALDQILAEYRNGSREKLPYQEIADAVEVLKAYVDSTKRSVD